MNRMVRVCVLLVCVLSVLGVHPQRAHAVTYGQPEVNINGGGGVLLDGSDGLSLRLNLAPAAFGGEKMCWRGQNYHDDPSTSCSSGTGGALAVILAVVDTAVPANTVVFNSVQSSSAYDGIESVFNTMTISDRTGTARIGYDSAVGSGSVALTYTGIVGSDTYTVKRTITYVAPNQYYTDDFEVIIPAGNPSNKIVKLYKGADIAPGGSQDGEKSILVQRPTLPASTVVALSPDANAFIGVREIPKTAGMNTFDGLQGEYYQDAFNQAWRGGNIGFGDFLGDPTDDTDYDDLGYAVQWTLGSTPGTYTRDMETFIGVRGVNATAQWSSTTNTSTGRVDITLTNTFNTARTGLGLVFSLPSPGFIVGNETTTCTGANLSVSGGVLTASNISVNEYTTCFISVDAASASVGATSFSKSNMTVSGSGLINAVGTYSTTFSSATTPPATATATATATPVSVAATATATPHPFAIADVDIGASFTLVVMNNGTLATWGYNRQGQTTIPRWLRNRLFNNVEVGSNYALALGRDGRVYGWGANNFGELNIPRSAQSGVNDISASLGHVMALKNNGDLVIWGRNDFKQLDAPLSARTGLSAISAGHSHSLAVKRGKVIAWGRNTWSQTNVPQGLKNVVAVAAGFDHSLALKSDGAIMCWGRKHEGQCDLPKGMKNVVAISAGVGYSLAMTRDGMVYGWGRNIMGQAKVPNGISQAGAISAGYVNSVIGLRDANVVTFGDARHGALVSRTPTVTP